MQENQENRRKTFSLKNDEDSSMIRHIEGILDIPVEEHRQHDLAPPLPRKDIVDFRQLTLSASRSMKALLHIVNNLVVFHHYLQILAEDFKKTRILGQSRTIGRLSVISRASKIYGTHATIPANHS